MTSLSEIKVSLTCTVSLVNVTSASDHDSEIKVMTGLVASFAKPFLFLQSSRLRFDYGHVGCSSIFALGVGVGAAMGTDDGAACGEGERRLGGEAAGWPLLSSSHVEVVIYSRQRQPGLVARAGNVHEGNTIVKYCWIMGLSFFPL